MSVKSGVSRRTAAASGAFVIARLGAKALDFISLMVLARLLTPVDFGLIAIAMVFVQVTEAIFEVPVGAVLMRARPLTRALLDTGFTVSSIRGLVVFGVLAGSAFAIAHLYSDPRLKWLILALAGAPLTRSFASIRLVLYGRRLEARPQFWLEVGGKAASLIVSVTVAATTRSYWAIAVATITSPIVSTAGSYFFAPYIPRFRLSEWRSFSGFMGWITLNQLFSSLLWQFDKLVLGRFVSARILGSFYVAGNLSTLPFQVIGTPILRPFAAAMAISHVRSTLTGAYQKATRGVCLIMAPIIIALAVLAHPIVMLLLGAKWEGASQWLALLALASLPALPIQTLPSLCIALNKAGNIAARSGVEFALYLPAVALGYFWLGIIGVIAAKFLSLMVSALFTLFLVRSLLNLSIRVQFKNLIEPAIAALVMGAVMSALIAVIPEPRGRIALAGYTFMVGGSGVIAYGLIAAALWHAAGRRDGAERVLADMLVKQGLGAKFIGAWRRS